MPQIHGISQDPRFLTGVPKEIFPHVLDFCKSISQISLPFYITPAPAERDDLNECPINVQRHIDEEGGEKVLGWQIWEWHGVMIEAEFHMLWRTTLNELRDVTPKNIAVKSILFLPDASLHYEDKQINNIRHPLIKDERVVEFIKNANEIFGFLNGGARAEMKEVTFSGDEFLKLQSIYIRQQELMRLISQSIPERNNLCRCGSGKKYKKCCLLNKT